MSNRPLRAVPRPSSEVPVAVRRVLDPVVDAIERRFLRRGGEMAVTRDDLERLGLVTPEQLRELDRSP